ncbi:MAG: GNAT family N-acetyltransferase [Butyrivibrio sp.]|nr:GNAT family N-acetyltransferase [Butyrivibrio sp.]
MENEIPDYINITPENIANEHLCCIIRSKKKHPGVEAKRAWLTERLAEGHVFRKRNVKATAFIEYAPLEKAWVPVKGDNFYYIYCLWTDGECRGKGYGKELMEYCISDARTAGKSGICILGSKKQKAWLTDQGFAKKYGFRVVDTTETGYELLALSFDGTRPEFTQKAKISRIESEELTIYYDMQCPYVSQSMDGIQKYCNDNQVPVSFIPIDTLEKAKDLPGVFNNWAVFYKGRFETVNLVGGSSLERILRKNR